MKPIRKKLKGIKRFRRIMDEISLPKPGLYELARDDTIICRCEEIPLGEIKNAIAEGCHGINDLKRMTRTCMGNCQGRMCGPVLQEIIARERGLQATDIDYLNVRPPTKPIPLAAFSTNGEL